MITKKEFVKEWISDLRSGKYKQGAGQLYNIENNTYCCLGVAECTLTRLGLQMEPNKQSQYPRNGSEFDKIMGSANPLVNGVYCGSRNDEYRQSFEMIANALEKQYLGTTTP